MSEFFKKIGLKPVRFLSECKSNIPCEEGSNCSECDNRTVVEENYPDLQGDTDNARYNRELLEEIILNKYGFFDYLKTPQFENPYQTRISRFGMNGLHNSTIASATAGTRAEALENLAIQISDEIKEEALKADWKY